ncbi:vacuolar protein sorting-associated protein 26C isoform X3 [Canis lupus baileyi]|uniref:vacuolar protein sorting-associated protein 26C isoform X2 n=1 Tax=Canis lupus familiaris TaxID=9615 RepID=UPI000BAA0331|nr:vacuolar protein sorting-associated protein 26C isoform X2 [Canis lupus familiaris]XP_038299417.1 vacuolar protein sorting-associated protein 26C isoform X2 [Canis lupus familiaris]XP_038437399.1 vacuolar protein sorting-associated protein 26C isoform X2 [Canis lupus familiaris]|eukprot:XP_022269053.1 Down syndrome critical region protein 3 isoform X2 [Canis lupus familiaris]
MGTSLDIKIKRANKVYHAGEVLSGVVVISGKDSIQHQGVSLTVEGSVNLQLSAKSVGVFEAFYNSVKPIQIINSTIEMVKPGKFPSGKTEIPFEFPLHVKGNKVLYETYHGVFVNIQYTLRCDMRRSLLAKDLTKTCEFIVHSAPQKGKLTPSPVDFTITPETLQNVKEGMAFPPALLPLSALDPANQQVWEVRGPGVIIGLPGEAPLRRCYVVLLGEKERSRPDRGSADPGCWPFCPGGVGRPVAAGRC